MECGWSLEKGDEIGEIDPPSAEELELLRWLVALPDEQERAEN